MADTALASAEGVAGSSVRRSGLLGGRATTELTLAWKRATHISLLGPLAYFSLRISRT